MKKIKSFFYLILCFAIALLVGCTNNNVNNDKLNAKVDVKSVAMIFPGEITDGGFNQYKYEGLKRAESEKGVKVAYKDNVTIKEQEDAIRNFAKDDFDVIVGQGAQFGDSIKKVSEEFPEKQFIVSVATSTYDSKNITTTNISYSEAGYLSGVMAALKTQNNKVAMIVGEWFKEHLKMKNSFLEGINSVNKNIETKTVETKSWSDASLAENVTNDLINEGYDVIFFCTDSAYKGILKACENNENVYAISSIVDAINEAPNSCIGSVVYNWEDLGYKESTGVFEKGKAYELGLNDGAISITYGKNFPMEKISTMVKAIEKLKNEKPKNINEISKEKINVGQLSFSGSNVEGFLKTANEVSEKEENNFSVKDSFNNIWFDDLGSMILALDSNKIEGIMIPSITANYLKANNSKYNIVKSELNPIVPFCMMLNKGKEDLRDRINSAIENYLSTEDCYKLLNNVNSVEKVEFEHFDNAETITFAVTGDLPPMDYVGTDGKPSGFNVKLISEICKILKVNAKVIQINSGARAIALATNKTDVVFWTKGQITDKDVDNAKEMIKHTNNINAEALYALFNDDGTPNEMIIESNNKINKLDQPENTIMTIPYFIDIYVPVEKKQ